MKYIAKIIIVITIFTAGVYIGLEYRGKPSASLNKEVKYEQEENKFSLMLDFGNGRVETYNDIEVGDITNVFELLKEVALKNDFKLEYVDSEMGVFIETIDGITNDFKSNRFWQFWVNNKYSLVGASSAKLKGGEAIEWKYIKQIN